MDANRLNENAEYKIVKKWLTANGVFSSSTYFENEQLMIKVSFKDKNDTVFEQRGSDLVRLTILLYNEVN